MAQSPAFAGTPINVDGISQDKSIRFNHLSSQSCSHVAVASDGSIVAVGTELSIWDNQLNPISSKPLPNPFHASELLYDHSGIVWMAGYGTGVYRYDPAMQTYKHFTQGKGGIGDNVVSECLDSLGQIWIVDRFSAELGLTQVSCFGKDGSWVHAALPKSTDPREYKQSHPAAYDHMPYEIAVRSNGEIWLSGMYGVLVGRAGGKKWSWLTDQDILPKTILSKLPKGSIFIWCYLKADSDSVWFGGRTIVQGGAKEVGYVARWKNNKWNTWVLPRNIEALCPDQTGGVWAASRYEVFHCVDGKRVTQATVFETPKVNYIYDVTRDSFGRLVLATSSGLLMQKVIAVGE